MSFESISVFEKRVAEFFGSPYAVAVDCCTHGIELALRYKNIKHIDVPTRTYISIPLLAYKLGINFSWNYSEWTDYYFLTEEIIDAAVLWKRNSYIEDKLMCISFQYRKHLNLGRGGMILCSSKKIYDDLKKMTYDGRDPDIPWREQNISRIGFHYYMTPETASLGLEKMNQAIINPPKKWVIDDWPDLTLMKIFENPQIKNLLI
jgi:dTDP-4-amino-4,6-dideoxygalactose transaminase